MGSQAPSLSISWPWKPPETTGFFYAPKVAFHTQTKEAWRDKLARTGHIQGGGGRRLCSSAPARSHGEWRCARIYLQHSWQSSLSFHSPFDSWFHGWACCHCLCFIGILSPIPLRPTLWDNHRSLWLLSAGYPFATLIFKAIVTSHPVGNTVMSQPALKCNLLFHRHSKTNVSKYYLFDELYCFQSWSCLYCCGFAFR